MSNFKGTKGKWDYSKQTGNIGHCFQAQIWRQDTKSLVIINPTETEQEANSNALLISKAPEMLEMLEDILSGMRGENFEVTELEIEKLIKEATEV
jgi:hypothetical protein